MQSNTKATGFLDVLDNLPGPIIGTGILQTTKPHELGAPVKGNASIEGSNDRIDAHPIEITIVRSICTHRCTLNFFLRDR